MVLASAALAQLAGLAAREVNVVQREEHCAEREAGLLLKERVLGERERAMEAVKAKEEAEGQLSGLQSQLEEVTSVKTTLEDEVTLVQAKLMRARREFQAAEGSRLSQADELNALRQQVSGIKQAKHSTASKQEQHSKHSSTFPPSPTLLCVYVPAQVLMLRAQLSASEEARTEAYAKLNGVFHGDEAQWMVRELLLNDELQEVEEAVTVAVKTQGKLDDEIEKNAELQAEVRVAKALSLSRSA